MIIDCSLDPRLINYKDGFLGIFGKFEFELVMVRFVEYLIEIDKNFLSSFNKYELEACGFFESFDDFSGSFPKDIRIIMDYFIKAKYFELKKDNRYIATGKLVAKLLPLVKK